MTRRRAAAAGAAAAAVWAVLEPLDRRLLRYDYSDVAVLGKLVTRGPAWPAVGVAWHLANGAVFGLVYSELDRRRPVSALRLALLEHVALYPLSALVDRRHPARGTRGVARLLHPRAFAQATVRHALFGAVLDRLATAAPRRRRSASSAAPRRAA
jgi:hypothetical protein